MTIPRNLSILAEGANATGVLSVGYGGTGLASTPANGALDIGNGTGFTRATLTAGSNITITNGSGSITIASTGGSGGSDQGGFQSSATALYSGWGIGGSSAATIVPTTSRIYYAAFQVGATTTFTKMGINVTVNQAAKVARLGIYNWSGGKSTTRVLDAGTVSLASTGVVEATISQSLSPGIYALAIITDGTTAELRAASIQSSVSNFMYGMNDLNSGSNTACHYEAGTGTTLPATATTTPTNLQSVPPIVYIRV
jgi:hypothetical protein